MTGPLQIVYYPEPVLLKRAAPVERVTPELAAFMEKMRDAMYAAHGVGLAAPQVGVGLRIIVIDTDDRFVPLVNPQIIARDGSQTGVEGCLSLPNLHADVTRALRITVQGLNLRGKKVTLSGDELWARAVQHEIDHLDGILFTERADLATFRWVTGDTDAEGELVERPTTREEAYRFFERDMALRA